MTKKKDLNRLTIFKGRIGAKMKENKGTIENWQVAYQVLPSSTHLTIDSTEQNVVVGELDGRRIKSSQIISIIGNELETENSIYKLGKPKINFRDLL